MPLNSISKGKGAFCFPPPSLFFFLQFSNFVLHLFQTAFCNKNVWLPCTRTKVKASADTSLPGVWGLLCLGGKGPGLCFSRHLVLVLNKGCAGRHRQLQKGNRVQNTCYPQTFKCHPEMQPWTFFSVSTCLYFIFTSDQETASQQNGTK